MRRASKKHKKELEKYSKLRKSFLTNNRGCQAVTISDKKCPNLATEIHHRKGRQKYLNVVASWMAVCPHCHKNIEKYDNINGISISPKKEFNIIKIWFKCKIKNIDDYLNIDNKYINSKNVLIKNN